MIEFPGYDQKFLAVQAPKPNMFDGFWQLVVEQNVTVIVMITRLVEGEGVKAHQYWPDKENKVLSLDNGMTVMRTRKQFNGSSVYHRKFVVGQTYWLNIFKYLISASGDNWFPYKCFYIFILTRSSSRDAALLLGP